MAQGPALTPFCSMTSACQLARAHVFSAAVGSAEQAPSSSSVRARQALSLRIQRIDPLSAPRDPRLNYERAPHATLGIAFAANCLLGLFFKDEETPC